MSTGQQRDEQSVSYAYVFGLVYLLCAAHRACITVFIRRDFGLNAFNPHALIALVFLLLAATGKNAFQIYFWLWLIALIGQRIRSFSLRHRGGHSRYQGYPWLAMYMPNVKTEEQARQAEPYMCLFGGMVIVTLSEPVGAFILAGVVSFGFCLAYDAIVDMRRMQAMRDIEHEMKYYSERYRG